MHEVQSPNAQSFHGCSSVAGVLFATSAVSITLMKVLTKMDQRTRTKYRKNSKDKRIKYGSPSLSEILKNMRISLLSFCSLCNVKEGLPCQQYRQKNNLLISTTALFPEHSILDISRTLVWTADHIITRTTWSNYFGDTSGVIIWSKRTCNTDANLCKYWPEWMPNCSSILNHSEIRYKAYYSQYKAADFHTCAFRRLWAVNKHIPNMYVGAHNTSVYPC